MSNWSNQMAGLSAVRTATHRTIFLERSETMLGGGRYIDGLLSRDPGNAPDVGVLRIGLLMGMVTATKLFAPSVLGFTTAVNAAGDVGVTVSATVAAELVRRVGATGNLKVTGPAATNGAVVTEMAAYSAVNLTTGVITTGALAGAHVAGSFLQPTDGSETPITFIPDTQAYGVFVLDASGNGLAAVDFPRLPVSGIVASKQFLPVWPADTSLQAWICARLNDSAGGQYVFDHHWGG